MKICDMSRNLFQTTFRMSLNSLKLHCLIGNYHSTYNFNVLTQTFLRFIYVSAIDIYLLDPTFPMFYGLPKIHKDRLIRVLTLRIIL